MKKNASRPDGEDFVFFDVLVCRAGARAADLGGPKFEIKHKSRCLQKKKLVNWEAKHVDWRGAGLSGPLDAGPAGMTNAV